MTDILVILLPILAGVIIVLAGVYIFLSRKVYAIDDLLGKKCIVSIEVNNFAGRGEVRVGNQTFACRTLFDADLYEVGDKVVVVAIEGPKLVCKKI